MLRKNAKVELIKRVPLFGELSRKDLNEVAGIADEIDLRDGKVLIREGELGHEFFVLLDGTVEVRKGKRRVATLGRGDFAGEIALLSKSPRTATVRATSPVRALVIARRNFWTLLDTSPQIQRKILEALAERLAPTAL
jgi:CRP-like cAMP-binding protein